ncbi:MAG: hypothetical protein U0175_08115 [Caldilineaceae bacterium]
MNIEEILARCITEIEHGVSIEECLSQYPGHNEELRPLLELALRFRSTRPIRLSDRAFERGRQLLRQQAQQSPTTRPQLSFLRRYRTLPTYKRAVIPPLPNPPIREVTRHRPIQPYLLWASALSSAALVVIAIFLFARLSDLDASNPLPQPPSASVPTYTATPVGTDTQLAPLMAVSITPTLSTPTATLTPTITLTTVPSTTMTAGEFLEARHTSTPALASTLSAATASPTSSPVPTLVTVSATATNPAMQPPAFEATSSPTPILVVTASSTPPPLPTSTATPTWTATASATTEATATSTATSTLTWTATSTDTATAEPPTATPTFPQPTETATDTPPDVTPTATFIFRPIITVEASLTPEEPTNGTIEHSVATPTPSSSETDGANSEN